MPGINDAALRRHTSLQYKFDCTRQQRRDVPAERKRVREAGAAREPNLLCVQFVVACVECMCLRCLSISAPVCVCGLQFVNGQQQRSSRALRAKRRARSSVVCVRVKSSRSSKSSKIVSVVERARVARCVEEDIEPAIQWELCVGKEGGKGGSKWGNATWHGRRHP